MRDSIGGHTTLLGTLPPENDAMNLYDDYREIMLQLSFMSLYAPAFALAPIFSLFNNLFEIRIDATKMLTHQRRSHCKSSNGIGIWSTYMEIINWLSVVVNGGLLCFTSNLIPMIVYRWHFYEGTPGSMEGYIDRMFPISPRNISECITELNLTNHTEFTLLTNNTFADIEGYDCFPTRFQSTKEPDGEMGQFYWHILTARLAYFIAFEHAAFLCKYLILRAIQTKPTVIAQMEQVEETIHDSLLVKFQPNHPEHDVRELANDTGGDGGGSSGGGGGQGAWNSLRKRVVTRETNGKQLLIWPSIEEIKAATTDGASAQKYFAKMQKQTTTTVV